MINLFLDMFFWFLCHINVIIEYVCFILSFTNASKIHLCCLYWRFIFILSCIPLHLLLFSHSVVSDSLWPCGLQRIKLPCPSPSPRACSNTCPWIQWCHPTILSSVIHFSSCLQSFPALVIHSAVDEHLGCFYYVIIINKTSTNICKQVFLWTWVINFLG